VNAVITAVRKFLYFWYDFIVGDDPIVAIGVVLALGATAALAHGNLSAWWLLPAATAVLLIASLIRAARAMRRR
jgi:hypothetical protein